MGCRNAVARGDEGQHTPWDGHQVLFPAHDANGKHALEVAVVKIP